jgi:hypothetical protein
MLLRQRRADLVELASPLAVGLVRDRRAQHAERDLVAVELRDELGLECRLALGVLARQVAEEPLGREPPEFPHSAVAVDRRADLLRRLERGQLGMALVDRLEVERLLVAREVEVELLVELGHEAVGFGPQLLQACFREGRARHGA